MHAVQIDAKPAYCQSPASLDSNDQLVKQAIAASTTLLSGKTGQIAQEFYGPCSSAPAWISHGTVTTSALTVWQALRDAANRGLHPNDYTVALVPPPNSTPVTAVSAQALASFDIGLTVGAMRMAEDLRCGRVDPHVIGADLKADCASFRPAEFVWALSHSDNPAVEFDTLEPSAPGYRRTEMALRHYLELARQPQIDLPAFTRAVHPGESMDGVEGLRELLLRTGDLASIGELRGPLYDNETVKAVQSFQRRHGLQPDGIVSAETYRQLEVPMAYRAEQLGLTLERWRWIQRTFPQPPVVVNVPEFKVRAYDENLRVALSMKVIVGGAYHRKTPVFQNEISSVVFRPYWNIPPSIQRKEVEPVMRRDPSYLKRHGYEIVRGPGGTIRIRQLPGEENSLGLVKFSLPNVHNVYLHGTPAQQLFERTRRDFSHGCIRVEDPVALATWVLRHNDGWTPENIQAAMHGTKTFSVALTLPIPVLIVYGTGFASEDGSVYFLPDIYGEDKELLAGLNALTLARSSADVLSTRSDSR